MPASSSSSQPAIVGISHRKKTCRLTQSRQQGFLCLLHSLLRDCLWDDALTPSGKPGDAGVEVLPRMFWHLLRRTFLDDRLVQRAEFARLWPGEREYRLRRGSCAKLVEEQSSHARRNVPTNEVHDEFGRDGHVAVDRFLLALLAFCGRRRRGSGDCGEIQLSTRQKIYPVPICVVNCDIPEFPSSSFCGVLHYGEGSNRQLDTLVTPQRILDGVKYGSVTAVASRTLSFCSFSAGTRTSFLKPVAIFPGAPIPGGIHHEAITAVTLPAERVQSCQVVSRELVPGP